MATKRHRLKRKARGTKKLNTLQRQQKEYAKEYKKEAQFVMSRCNHHIHLSDPKTGVRLPLAGCRSKKAKHKCKGLFPLKKKLTFIPKVIYRGNARK